MVGRPSATGAFAGIAVDHPGQGAKQQGGREIYQELCYELGGEMAVLAKASASDLAAVAGERVALAVLNARMGQVTIEPGFDGRYGTVSISG